MRFIDIHSHILSSVDDGAEHIDMSLEMVEQAADLNIEHVVATPHATEMTTEKLGLLFVNRFDHLQKEIKHQKIDIQISLASELFFSELVFKWLSESWASYMGKRKYLLFELPLFEIPNKVDEFIYQCRLNGIVPILAHPERYMRLHESTDLLLKWYGHGSLMQLNAGSLVGQFGERIKDFSKRLLQSGIYQFIASDAHEIYERNFEVLVQASNEIAEDISAEYAEQLCFINPGKVINGEKIKVLDNVEIPELRGRFKQIFRKLFALRA